jgi:lysophospholipase L1-like esterase
LRSPPKIALAIAILSLIAGWPFYSRAQTVPQARQRVLVVGDSLAGGAFAQSADGGYAYLVARELDADLGVARAVDVPAAQSLLAGWGWNADIAIIELGLNDVSGVSGNAYPESEWQDQYGALIDLVASKAERVIVFTVFYTAPGSKERHDAYLRYNDYIKLAAADRSVEVVDIWAATVDCAGCLSLPTDSVPIPPFSGDNFHPGSHGHAVIADAILSKIKMETFVPVVLR